MLIAACGRDTERLVDVPVDSEAWVAAEAWNHMCGVELFRRGPGDIRFMWADSLGANRLAYTQGSLVLMGHDLLDGMSEQDHIAVAGHELYHVLTSGTQGDDGYGHHADGGWSRAVNGTDWPNEGDLKYLKEAGYPCRQ